MAANRLARRPGGTPASHRRPPPPTHPGGHDDHDDAPGARPDAGRHARPGTDARAGQRRHHPRRPGGDGRRGPRRGDGGSGPGSPSAASEPAAPATEALAEPPTAAFPAKAKFVGEAATAKGPIPIAITVDGGRAKAYVCDGKKIEAWLQGTAKDGTVELTGRKGARLSGKLVGDAVEGTVVLAGYPEWTFSAGATKSTRAGIYRASAGGATTGWIVRDDAGREQVGMLRDATGAERTAPPLDVAGPAPAAAVPGLPAAVDGDTDVLPTGP